MTDDPYGGMSMEELIASGIVEDPDAMTEQEQAEANIAACHEALKAFEPIATPELMRKLMEAVEQHEADVRRANNLPDE